MARIAGRRAPASKVELPPTTGLSKPRVSERLRGLMRQRKALLTKIKQEQKQRERLTESARDTMTLLLSRIRPLIAEREQLSATVHGVFRELLREGRLAKAPRRKVADLYRTLCEVLDATPDEPEDRADTNGRARPEPSARQAEPPFARAGSGADEASVRDVFRRLALALHPDRATSEEDRRERTEVMKRLSQAFQAGDLAALLEAEQRWLSGARDPSAGPNLEAQCSALERAVTALKEQLRALRAEVKELKRSPEIALAESMARGPGKGADELREAEEEVRAELQQLRELLRFADAFREGELSLAEFLRGPPMQPDDVDVAELLFEFFDAELAASPPRGARRANRARGQ